MNAKKIKNTKFTKVVSYLLLLLVLFWAVGFFAFYTDGFTEKLKRFSIVIDGNNVATSSGGYTLGTSGTEVRFKFLIPSEQLDYTVSVVAKEDVDFDFFVDGKAMSFNAEQDYTQCFIVEKHSNYFTISPVGSLTDILQSRYPDSEVHCNESDVPVQDLFTMVIRLKHYEDVVKVHFTVITQPDGITVDKQEVIF